MGNFLGIDLGGMSAKCAEFSNSKLSEALSAATNRKDPPEKTADLLSALCERVSDLSKIDAVGIGAPGIVDSERGLVVSWTTFGWKNVPLAALLKERLKKEVYLLNDANAAALGEAKYGAGKNFSSSVLFTIGTGVGCGIVLNGAIFEGFLGAGGEAGHMSVDFRGRKCSCGRRGCLETYASTRALIRSAEREIKKDPTGALSRLSKGKADGKTIFLALKEGDAGAKRVFSKFIDALGEGIANVVNLLRPEAVLIGGGISEEGETLLAPLREAVFQKVLISPSIVPLSIEAAALKNRAGLFGAAEFAREQFEKEYR